MPSEFEVAGLARTYEYPAKTSMVLRSCAWAVTPTSDAKASKDTTTLSFILPPLDLYFGAGRQNCRAAARFAVCLRQEGDHPHLLIFFFYIQMRTKPEKLP